MTDAFKNFAKVLAVWVTALLVCLLLCMSLGGCRAKKEVLPEVVTLHERDTVTVTKTIEKTLKPDTVFVEIPAQIAERTTRDSVSHLENDFAESWARMKDGVLSHTLKSKPGKLPVEVMTPQVTTTTEKGEVKYIEKPVPVKVLYPEERRLTAWEKFRLEAFRWVAAALALCLLWIFRAPLLRWLKKIFK